MNWILVGPSYFTEIVNIDQEKNVKFICFQINVF